MKEPAEESIEARGSGRSFTRTWPKKTVFAAAACGLGSLVISLLAASTPLEPFGKYPLAARHLLEGLLPTERLLDFSPLYLWLNVGLLRLGLDPLRVLEGMQIGLAALCAALLFALLEPRVGGRLAVLGAFVFALDRHLLVYQRVLEPEMVLLAALLGALVLLERGSPGAAAGAGLLAAVAVLTRPTFLPVFLAVPLYYRWRRWPGWKKLSALFLLPLAVGALLLGLHAGSPLAPVMNPGTVFFEGNQPLSRGTSAIYPPLVLAMQRAELDVADSAHDHYRTVARAAPETPIDATPAEVNRLWAGRARGFLLDHPAVAVERFTTKLRYALHGFRWHDVPPAARYERRLRRPPFSLPFSLLAALALVGLAAAARRWREALPFYVLFAVQLAVMLTFYVSARQRLVLLPAIVFFALLALRAIFDARRKWFPLVLVATLALALTLPDDAMHDESYRQRGYLEAGPRMAALQHGAPLSRRGEEVVEAMAAMPWWVDWMRPAFVPQDDRTLDERLAEALLSRRGTHPPFGAESADFDLAQALIRVGRDEEARPILRQLSESGFIAYRGGRAPSDPRILLAEVAERGGRNERAIALLEASLAERPADPFALAALAAVDRTREESAVAEIDRRFGEPDRRWIYGRTLRRLERPARAAEELRPLAERLPHLRALRVELALALGAAGEIDAAAAELLAANRLHVEPVLDVESSAEIARRWAARHADDAEVQLLAARLFDQHGFTSEAIRRLEALRLEGPGSGVALAPELAASLEESLAEMRTR